MWLCANLFLFQTLAAQPPALPDNIVQTFGAANGLASSEIVSLYQDKQDFIWIGTRSGISRYDGYSFQNFEFINNNRIGSVNNIAEDKNAVLWMTAETGLYYWNGKFFTHYSFVTEEGFLPFGDIDFNDNSVWLGTAKGPVKLPHLQLNMVQDLNKNILAGWDKVSIGDGSVTAISISKKGIAFGAYYSVYSYQNGQLKKIPNAINEREYLRNLFIDDDGNVYWNNILTGFFYWDGQEVTKVIGGDAFYFDIFSKDGNTYVYASNNIRKLNPSSKQLQPVASLHGLPMRSPTRLLIDRENNYWAGSLEGLFKLKKKEFALHINADEPYTDDVYSGLRRKNGELIFGTNRGRIFEMKQELKPYKKIPQVVPLAEVFYMFEDDDESLWFGTGYQGIAYYKNGNLKNFTRPALPDNSHYYFFKDRYEQLWSAGDMGITKIKNVAKDSFQFQPLFYQPSTKVHKLNGIVQSPQGKIWAAGTLGVFYVNDKDSLSPYSIPELKDQKLFINDIKKDSQGNVWIASRGHGIMLCTFDKQDKLRLKQQWKTENGTNSNSYLSIAFDKANNTWAGSYQGVTAMVQEKESYSIKNFDVQDGFINQHYQALSLFADGDTMWACTTAGLVSFSPATLLQQKRHAQLHITSIDLLNSKKTAEEYLLKDEKQDAIEYNFPNSINSFSIQFAALYYSNPQAARYYYKLQGVDSGWTSTGSERTILFRQLPPGDYTLLVKASIGGSEWTNTVTILFTVNKPWWLQWWAIGGVAALIALVIFYYVKNRERKLKLREQINTEIEKLKSASYQHQLEIEQVISYFATSLNEHTTVDGVLWDVARNCISRLGFEDCVIYLKNEEGDKLMQKAAWGPKTTEENRIVNPIEIPLGKGIVGNVAVTGKAEKINDTSKDERYIVDDEARASEITVPIYDGDKVIGVIDSEHQQRNFYTDRHLHILTTIASHCGAKISTLKAEATTASAKMESLLNKQKALEASLQSMRLQMNPHFLFNALNSIQQMILSGDETTATRFLSKFSKLLRTILTNSDKKEISLKEEMDLLQLYVELESLRFKESFSFSINCDKDIDAEEVFVPALFFQPMVENAIWHGLMHKAGDRKLLVQFNECGETCLRCTIEDNGVGRQSANTNGNAEEHTGKGLSVAIERLRALNEKNNWKNSLEITDLKNENGLAAGTRIEIILYYN